MGMGLGGRRTAKCYAVSAADTLCRRTARAVLLHARTVMAVAGTQTVRKQTLLLRRFGVFALVFESGV
eukprot:EW704463.1.p2 GENE.EW704463.1~~EW704463.1.p2  ORF type:complete len:68 (-),score=6.80 EW704463.1:138-341(-)